MKQILAEIKDGGFARRWIAENQAGRPEFERMRRTEKSQPIEEVGARLRQMMSFVQPVTIKPGD
jgi:ketol-acid reductoisomerase